MFPDASVTPAVAMPISTMDGDQHVHGVAVFLRKGDERPCEYRENEHRPADRQDRLVAEPVGVAAPDRSAGRWERAKSLITITEVISICSVVSMNTVKNGAARLTARFQVPKKVISLRKFGSASGRRSIVSSPTPVVCGMGGSGMALTNLIPRAPHAAPTSISTHRRSHVLMEEPLPISTKAPPRKLNSALRAAAIKRRFAKTAPRRCCGTKSRIQEFQLHPARAPKLACKNRPITSNATAVSPLGAKAAAATTRSDSRLTDITDDADAPPPAHRLDEKHRRDLKQLREERDRRKQPDGEVAAAHLQSKGDQNGPVVSVPMAWVAIPSLSTPRRPASTFSSLSAWSIGNRLSKAAFTRPRRLSSPSCTGLCAVCVQRTGCGRKSRAVHRTCYPALTTRQARQYWGTAGSGVWAADRNRKPGFAYRLPRDATNICPITNTGAGRPSITTRVLRHGATTLLAGGGGSRGGGGGEGS